MENFLEGANRPDVLDFICNAGLLVVPIYINVIVQLLEDLLAVFGAIFLCLVIVFRLRDRK